MIFCVYDPLCFRSRQRAVERPFDHLFFKLSTEEPHAAKALSATRLGHGRVADSDLVTASLSLCSDRSRTRMGSSNSKALFSLFKAFKGLKCLEMPLRVESSRPRTVTTPSFMAVTSSRAIASWRRCSWLRGCRWPLWRCRRPLPRAHFECQGLTELNITIS